MNMIKAAQLHVGHVLDVHGAIFAIKMDDDGQITATTPTGDVIFGQDDDVNVEAE